MDNLAAESIEHQIRDEYFEGEWYDQYTGDNIQYVATELMRKGFSKQEVFDLIATVVDAVKAEYED